MEIEVKDYTYETMPDYTDQVEGAKEINMTGDELWVRYYPDVVYDEKKGLRLQMIVPTIFNDPGHRFPCIVFVQGSGWFPQKLYVNVNNMGFWAKKGYVCAIVEYRSSLTAHFPAQINDAKNAVRFLKKNADEYGIEKDNIVIMGDSSGGHTCVLAGMTAKSGKLDEPIYEESCEVKGIIDLYGSVDVTLPYGFPSTTIHQLPNSPEGMLMGYNIREHEEEAKVANAKEYVQESFPPILILHGTKDKTVFCQESVDLYQALKAAGKDAELYLVRKAEHAGGIYWTDETINIYDQFIRRCLKELPSES